MDSVPAEVISLITSLGATGVLFLWLTDVRAALKSEREAHTHTLNELKQALRDCSRLEDVTRRTYPATPPVVSARRSMGDE